MAIWYIILLLRKKYVTSCSVLQTILIMDWIILHHFSVNLDIIFVYSIRLVIFLSTNEILFEMILNLFIQSTAIENFQLDEHVKYQTTESGKHLCCVR